MCTDDVLQVTGGNVKLLKKVKRDNGGCHFGEDVHTRIVRRRRIRKSVDAVSYVVYQRF
jgi:hypothetical protein